MNLAYFILQLHHNSGAFETICINFGTCLAIDMPTLNFNFHTRSIVQRT